MRSFVTNIRETKYWKKKKERKLFPVHTLYSIEIVFNYEARATNRARDGRGSLAHTKMAPHMIRKVGWKPELRPDNVRPDIIFLDGIYPASRPVVMDRNVSKRGRQMNNNRGPEITDSMTGFRTRR